MEAKRRGCYSLGQKKIRPSGWWGDRHITWGAKRKRMLFSRREEQTQWVVGCQTHHMGCKKKEDVIQ